MMPTQSPKNSSVSHASELAAHLRGRGALVGFLEWDVARGKGIDDHLAIGRSRGGPRRDRPRRFRELGMEERLAALQTAYEYY